MSNHSSIFYHGYGIFIFHISWLVPAFKAFSYHWCPHFLVHFKTTNIRSKSVFFCPFVTHALLLFLSYKHMHCLSTESEAPQMKFCYFNFLFLEIKKVTPDNKSQLNLIMYWTTGVLCNKRKTIASSDEKVTTAVILTTWRLLPSDLYFSAKSQNSVFSFIEVGKSRNFRKIRIKV